MNVVAQVPSGTTQGIKKKPTAEQRVLLYHLSWQDYQTIGRVLHNHPNVRLTYDRESLEIMTTSPEHEVYKKRLGRFFETLAEEFNLPIAPAGNMTFQREDLERGLESDECFWIAHEPQMRAKLEWDPGRDPPPDLVIEIEISRSALSRMSIYAALGVPEVWCFDGETLTVHLLQANGTYGLADQSPTFPGVSLAGIARFLKPSETIDYLGMIRAFRTWIREQLAQKEGGDIPGNDESKKATES
jgi:Uma2 family endonuclease